VYLQVSLSSLAACEQGARDAYTPGVSPLAPQPFSANKEQGDT
jgi:hypothetical protein